MQSSRIKKLGKPLHKSDLGHFILKNPAKLPKIGSYVVNQELENIGLVIDIFGPVETPYISVRVKEQFKEKISPDSELFIVEKRVLASKSNQRRQMGMGNKDKGRKKQHGR